ncbi:cytochrome b5 [Strigomonas culicis]|uniref:Cytochrome b5 n=1 Tax=Strigomonas culicis TaxID=28005 RepID=S9VQS2_9TRYP|nr:cytochrome b5 [Strigomonas culicis]EPY37021.1 cytochrome b5 [Strigomonas culicis]|eukprot:EPY29466.1 cytochrome b5 [Strigomonas culicis]
MSQAELPSYTWEEIKKHDKDDDCWVVMYDKVLDVSKWLNIHPGGLDPIKDMAGLDITSSFESIGHTSTALVKSKTFIIGRVEGGKAPAPKPAATEERKKWSETSRAELRNYKGGEGIIPLWQIVAGLVVLLLMIIYAML